MKFTDADVPYLTRLWDSSMVMRGRLKKQAWETREAPRDEDLHRMLGDLRWIIGVAERALCDLGHPPPVLSFDLWKERHPESATGDK